MKTDKLVCDHCGELLPFDKAKWTTGVFKTHRKSINERINENGRKGQGRRKGENSKAQKV
jgi:hypothetical protein